MKKVTAIICAYNEENTLNGVITSVAISPLIDEIIVVNDGSTDQTANVIESMKLTTDIIDINMPENKGKGYAMATGVENATGEIIVFIDADISNLHEEHLSNLLGPVLNNEADMVLGQPSDTLINYKINPFRSLTGQRALRKKDIIHMVSKIKSSRFGVETLINLYYQANEKTVKYIMLKDLKHPTKFQKADMSTAMKEFAFEGQQIGLAVLNNFDLVVKSVKKIILNK